MKKKVLSLSLVMVLLAIGIVGGTSAYFTYSEVTRNVITTGGVALTIREWMDESKEEGDEFPKEGMRIMPGAEITKIVEIENTGLSDAYVRVKVQTIVDMESSDAIDHSSFISMDLNDKEWTLKDGYYYYNKSLSSGEITVPLFTTVTFSKDMGNVYQNSTINIDILAHGVQAEYNGESSLEAKGWPKDTTL